MFRLCSMQIVGLAFCALSALAATPVAPPNPPLNQEPLIVQLRAASPEMVPTVTKRLEDMLAAGRLQGEIKGGATPTSAERAEMAANPSFGQAFENRPDQALHLLRFVNDILGKTGH